MRVLLRIVALLAAVSVIGTLWFVLAFTGRDALRSLMASGTLGILTILGWVVAVLVGPVAVVQLWRCRESGRRAGIVLFGYGLAYYAAGLFVLRRPGASVWQILAAAATNALPLMVLLSRRARETCTKVKQPGPLRSPPRTSAGRSTIGIRRARLSGKGSRKG